MSQSQIAARSTHPRMCTLPVEHTGQDAAVRPVAVQPVTPAGGQHAPGATLDQVLAEQAHAQTLLLPTPTNMNPIHISRSDLLQFAELQQRVAADLNIKLPLLNGMFVLVSSGSLQQQQQACSGSDSSALTASIPWRLRQVSAVEVAPGADPADATVVLVGGDRVRAGAVREGQLDEAQDHQYLCCEVAALQHCGQLRQLKVFDVAHMAWRLRVACKLQEAFQTYEQGGAGAPGLETLTSTLQELPPPGWTGDEILQYVELNPLTWPESPDQPWQLLSTAQYGQLLQGAAAAWQHYVQHKLAGQQPQLVTNFAPWNALTCTPSRAMSQQQETADLAGAPAGTAAVGDACACCIINNEAGVSQQQELAGPDISSCTQEHVASGSGSRAAGAPGCHTSSPSLSPTHHTCSTIRPKPGRTSSTSGVGSKGGRPFKPAVATDGDEDADDSSGDSSDSSSSSDDSSSSSSDDSSSSSSDDDSSSSGNSSGACRKRQTLLRSRSKNPTTKRSRAQPGCDSTGHQPSRSRSRSAKRRRCYSPKQNRSTDSRRPDFRSGRATRSTYDGWAPSSTAGRSRSAVRRGRTTHSTGAGQGGSTRSKSRGNRSRPLAARPSRSSSASRRLRSRGRSSSNGRNRSSSRGTRSKAATARLSRSSSASRRLPQPGSRPARGRRTDPRRRSDSPTRDGVQDSARPWRRSDLPQPSPMGFTTASIPAGRPAYQLMLRQLRRKPASLHFNPTDPWSQYVEVQVQAWLQQLAVRVLQEEGPPEPSRPHSMMDVIKVLCEHEHPEVVSSHYGNTAMRGGVGWLNSFGRARPELQWEARGGDSTRRFRLHPSSYRVLLATTQLGKPVQPMGTTCQQDCLNSGGRGMDGRQQLAQPGRPVHQGMEGQGMDGIAAGQQQQGAPQGSTAAQGNAILSEQDDSGWPAYLLHQRQQLELQARAACVAAAMVQSSTQARE